jgi:hypothetical protein
VSISIQKRGSDALHIIEVVERGAFGYPVGNLGLSVLDSTNSLLKAGEALCKIDTLVDMLTEFFLHLSHLDKETLVLKPQLDMLKLGFRD